MNYEIKKGVENSLKKLSNEIRRTKKKNDSIKKTAMKFTDLAKEEVGTSELKWIGSTSTNLSVNYKDKGFDVDVLLIHDQKSKEDLVKIKFKLINIFREFANKNYDKVKIHNKKPVISIRFLTNNGNDKFHIDFVIATETNNSIEFIYSENPNEENKYEIYKNESVEMVEHFNKKIDENNHFQESIVVLKWWNDNITKNFEKDVRLASSLISEVIVNDDSNSTTIIDALMQALEKIKLALDKGKFESMFESNLDYLRKMDRNQLNKMNEEVKKLLTAFKNALNKTSIEDAIAILKKYFDCLEVAKAWSC